MPLKKTQAEKVRNILLTNATASNEALIDYFVNVVNISEKQAKEYLASRQVYLTHPAFASDREKVPYRGFQGMKEQRELIGTNIGFSSGYSGLSGFTTHNLPCTRF